jgi:hypothetical protein
MTKVGTYIGKTSISMHTRQSELLDVDDDDDLNLFTLYIPDKTHAQTFGPSL